MGEGDEKLNVEAQAQIIALTSAYYNAKTKNERDAISTQAKAIRADEASKNTIVVTPTVFQTTVINMVVNKAVDTRGYMTATEWKSVTTTVGITTTISNQADSYAGGSRTTTTTIGRTNLAVTSSYGVAKDTQSVGFGMASIALSYNVTPNEMKFITSMANSSLSLEQV